MIKLFNGMNRCGKGIALLVLLMWTIISTWGIIDLATSNRMLELPLCINFLLFMLGGVLMFVWRIKALPPKEAAGWLPVSPKYTSGNPQLNTIAFLGYELVIIGAVYFMISFCWGFV